VIRHILKKDWILYWPMVALVSAIQVAFEWAQLKTGLFAESDTAIELLRPLSFAWFLGIGALTVAVVQQDPIPGADQDWLIRPLKRSDLLLAKMIFLAAAICAPMFVLNLAHALALGFPLAESIKALSYKECSVFALFIMPMLALGAATRSMAQLALLGAAMMVVFAAAAAAGAVLLGVDRCPTCDSGISWLQHLLQHAGVLLGAIVIVTLQYSRRRTDVSRAFAVIGMIALVFVQMPWNVAFAIQARLSGVAGGPIAVSLEPASDVLAINAAAAAALQPAASGRAATRALLEGNADPAVDYLARRTRHDAPVALELPVVIDGVAADELLLVDRSEVRLIGGAGRLLYSGANIDESSDSLFAAADGPAAHPIVRIPRNVFSKTATQSVALRMEYSLTLVKVAAQHKIAALDGELRSSDMGLCGTRLQQNALALRCIRVGRTPFCYSATLYGPDGTHNPEVLKCRPDYRPYVPTLFNVLNYAGLDLPVHDRYGLARYAVETSELSRAYVLLKVYAVRGHFTRTLNVSHISIGK
jgi:hypothetical protein